MNTHTKSKIIKIAWLLPLLIFICIVASIISLSLFLIISSLMMSGIYPYANETISVISVAAIYLIFPVIAFKLIHEKIKNPNFIARLLIYFFFFLFSIAFLFAVFRAYLPFEDFLRAHQQRSKSSMWPSLFFAAMVSGVSYIILLLNLELNKLLNSIVKPLVYWFFTILLGWYLSLPLLFLYTGFDYQKKCIWGNAKEFLASKYCYEIGESVHRQWQIMPAVIILILEAIFMILYFKYNKEKRK